MPTLISRFPPPSQGDIKRPATDSSPPPKEPTLFMDDPQSTRQTKGLLVSNSLQSINANIFC